MTMEGIFLGFEGIATKAQEQRDNARREAEKLLEGITE